MDYRAIVMHDEALSFRPEGGKHDSSLCPICSEWALSEDGTPSGIRSLPETDREMPYGEIAYADPGLRDDNVHRFPIESEVHARQSLELLRREDVASKYSTDQLKTVINSVEEAIAGFDKSSMTDLVEGGKAEDMDTMTQQTHEALLAQEVQNATRAAEEEKARLTESVEALRGEKAALEEEKATLEAQVTELTEENERVNGELDSAQVKLKNAEDEAAALKEEIVTRDEQAEKSKLSQERADQVKNLGLFPEEYITEKASRWADVPEEEWDERIEEWKQAKASESPSGPTETASSFTGSSESEDTDKPTARKRVLGLA